MTGLYAPEEWGGQGLSLGDGIRVYEELGKGDGAYAFALSMHNICTFAVCGFGSETLKTAWARDLTSGRKLANFALTEPQSGSDAATMYSKARINPDGTWTISGAKAWVSLAGEADIYLTVVKTSDEPGHKDMAMIAIPKGAKGLSFGPLYDTPSYNFLPMGEMYLDDVTVPDANIILPVGKGLQGSLMAIDIARVSIASGCCGLMEAALDTALSYTKNRKMFGGHGVWTSMASSGCWGKWQPILRPRVCSTGRQPTPWEPPRARCLRPMPSALFPTPRSRPPISVRKPWAAWGF